MRDAESALQRARRAAGARPAPRGRRLRHRLLVAGVPRTAAGRGAQDRPLVHRGRRRCGKDSTAIVGAIVEPRARAAAVDRRRGHRDPRAVPAAAGAWAASRAGLPVRPRPPGRGVRRRSPPRVRAPDPPRRRPPSSRRARLTSRASHSRCLTHSRLFDYSSHPDVDPTGSATRLPRTRPRSRPAPQAPAPLAEEAHARHAADQALARPRHRHARLRPPLALRRDVLAPDARPHRAAPAPPPRRPLRPQPEGLELTVADTSHALGLGQRDGSELADRAHAAAPHAVRPRVRGPDVRQRRGPAQHPAGEHAPPPPAPERPPASRTRSGPRRSSPSRRSRARAGEPGASRSRCSSRATTPTTSSACCTRSASIPRCVTRARSGRTSVTATRSTTRSGLAS